MLKSDLLTVMRATTDGTLAETPVEFSDKNACCVIMASKGYPVAYEKGYEIDIPDEIRDSVYVGVPPRKRQARDERRQSSRRDGGRRSASGGNSLGIRKGRKIHFENAFYRHDIGAKALAAGGKINGIQSIRRKRKRSSAQEAKSLLSEANDLLGIKDLKDVRVINRYDAENITSELF